MWFSKKTKNDEKNILYVSVDGRSIAVGFYTGNVCHYSERRIQIAGETKRPIEILFKDILFAFKHVNTRKIDEIQVILDIPWVKEIPTSVKEKRLKPFVVADKVIQDLIKKETDSKKNTLDKNDAFLGFYIENIKLNGYTYKEYTGKITDEIEVFLTRFSGEKEIMDLIESSIKSFWNKTHISFITSSELLFKKSLELNPVNDIFVHLGSTHTNFRIYSESVLSKSININFGFQNIVQKLDEIWKTDSAESKHWISLLINKELNNEEETRISNDIQKCLLEMRQCMEDVIKSGVMLSLERPMHVSGIDNIWANLFSYAFKHKFFGEIFPHTETTIVDILNKEDKDSKGDSLIALYVEQINK